MNKVRVLIVEDEKNIAEDIKISLWNLGYEVVGSVASGFEAIKKVNELNPDVVLMDIELEGEMNGLEATDIIKTEHDVPIIYITSHIDKKTIDSAKITDPIAYLIKPFEEKELSVTLEMALYKYKLNKIIKKSEEKYRTLVETIEEGIGIVDEHENFIFMNSAGAKIFGLSPNELIGKNISEFLLQDEFKKILNHTLKRIQGESSKFDLKIHRKDNTLRYITVATSPRFSDDKYIGAFAILSDNTETRLAEEKLKKTERRLTTIFNNAPNIVLYEKGGDRMFISENVCQLTGYTANQLIAKKPEYLSLIHHEDINFITQKYRKWKTDNNEKNMLTQWYRLKKADGNYVWIEDRQVKVRNGDNKIIISGIMIDNSTLKKAEEAFRESEKRYKAVVEDQTEFINRYKADGTFIFVNEAYCRYLEKKREELIGKNWLEFFPIEKQEVVRKRLFSLTPQKPVATYEYRKISSDNEIKWEEWTYRAFFNEQGEIMEFQSVGKDITDRKNATEQVVKERNRASFFNDLLAHDINNLNHGIFSYLNIIINMEDFPDKFQKKINTCIHLSEEISTLISKIRIFSELSEDTADIKKVDLKKTLLNSIKTIKMNYSQDKKIKIFHDFESDTIIVLANELLETVVYNILNNAVKHNHNKDVEIFINHHIVEQNDLFYYQIEFADNGPGIEDSYKEKIFNRMERVDADNKIHGFGLGLTLVRNIIEHYAGKVWVTDRIPNDYTQGSKFVVLIPQK